MKPVGKPSYLRQGSFKQADRYPIIALGGQYKPEGYFNHLYATYTRLEDFDGAQVDNFFYSDPFFGYVGPVSRQVWSCPAKDWILRDQIQTRGIEEECSRARDDDRKTWYRHVKSITLGKTGEEYYRTGFDIAWLKH